MINYFYGEKLDSFIKIYSTIVYLFGNIVGNTN